MTTPSSTRPRLRWLGLIVGLAGLIAVGACHHRSLIVRLFGPPTVEMRESYAADDGDLVFDHSTLNDLLRRHVQSGGYVDYAGLQADSDRLDVYLQSLSAAPFDDLGRDEKLALLINAYNAFTLRLILDHLPLESIRDIPSAERWDAVRWSLAGNTYSLNQIEHEQIRPHFAEPRIHFALVCAAIGCPPLRAEVYTGANLEDQLHSQADYVHANDRWLQFNPSTNEAKLTALYEWYQGDFDQASGSILQFAARYAPALKDAIESENEPKIDFLSYDWGLNRVSGNP